ncbi:MAG: OmpH family outer membrane protein [Prevotellaceae bacterium]|jgi:outer membrane protein|nr:OmpH family outer membrane protein [Prevotellaceae bacterium]
MKSILKVFLFLAFVFLSINGFAQKVGHINYIELIQSMPETAAVNKELEALSQAYGEELETIEVEMRNKFVVYQNNSITWTKEVSDEKLAEIQALSEKRDVRAAELEREFQQKQDEKLAPIFEKAQNAINKVAKDNGVACILNAQAILYADPSSGFDLLPLVKKELGI